MTTNRITVAIPTHSMQDASFFFQRCLDSLWNQTYQNFDIVVTDNSEDDLIEKICEWYKTGITYYRNPIKGMAPNTNEAIKRSHGNLIKILYMDDYLYRENVLEEISKKFKGGWLISGADNNPSPEWTRDITTGNNRLGSPSALTIENNEPLLFDETLTWLLDCDLYARLHGRYGKPTVMSGRSIGIGLGPHQMTHLISDEIKLSEHSYLEQKYA